MQICLYKVTILYAYNYIYDSWCIHISTSVLVLRRLTRVDFPQLALENSIFPF